jgi:hypothetical protein
MLRVGMWIRSDHTRLAGSPTAPRRAWCGTTATWGTMSHPRCPTKGHRRHCRTSKRTTRTTFAERTMRRNRTIKAREFVPSSICSTNFPPCEHTGLAEAAGHDAGKKGSVSRGSQLIRKFRPRCGLSHQWWKTRPAPETGWSYGGSPSHIGLTPMTGHASSVRGNVTGAAPGSTSLTASSYGSTG